MPDLVRELRERIEELEEEIRQIRADMLQTDATFAGVLTRQQITLLNGIYGRKVASYQAIDRIMAADGNFCRGSGEDLEKLRSKVAIYNLRKKLTPYGIEIKTWRGIGYYLDDENKAKLKKLMEKKDD